MKKLLLICFLAISGVKIYSQSIFQPTAKNLPSEIKTDVQKGVYFIASIEQLEKRINAFDRPKDDKNKQAGLFIDLPVQDGSIVQFFMIETPVLKPALQKKHPKLRSFTGSSINVPGYTAKVNFSPQGIRAVVNNGSNRFYIDPYSSESNNFYVGYVPDDLKLNAMRSFEDIVIEDLASATKTSLPNIPLASASSSNDLLTYDLALACTGEYGAYVGGTEAEVLALMTTIVTRVNEVYERELGIRFILVDDNDELIFLDPQTDPYNSSNINAMMNKNKSTINSIIGKNNYDIGHLLALSNAGQTLFESVCSSNKAKGMTGSLDPIGDAFTIDCVCHQIAHQFGATHTNNNDCNRNAQTAYEPGSGSSIMGLAGRCYPNLQDHSDEFFHASSITQIRTFVTQGSGATCPTSSSTGNHTPSVVVFNDGASIPSGTPFELEASGDDQDNDALSFSWEQYDLGEPTAATDEDLTLPYVNAPIIRSYTPAASGIRSIPNLPDLINGSASLGEMLPSYSRDMTFMCTVRDNHVGSGAYAMDSVTIHIDGDSGPFKTTYPIGGETLQTGDPLQITWDVAGSDQAPIHCLFVDLLISFDGGYTFADTIVANVPNSGMVDTTVPAINAETVRIKIKAKDNIFFAITPNDFSIEVPEPSFCLGDYNMTGDINTSDLLILLAQFGCPNNCSADLSGDDQVNSSDLLLFLGVFGTSCQ